MTREVPVPALSQRLAGRIGFASVKTKGTLTDVSVWCRGFDIRNGELADVPCERQIPPSTAVAEGVIPVSV